MSSEKYTPGHTVNAVAFMARRTIETHGAFILPLLKSGQRILDCGCGPGGITIGVAKRIAPGEVIGIDVGAEQLDRARSLAAQEKANATFQEGSIYELPFNDGVFDGVISHALFEHLRDPLRALAEIHRVLRPGGFVALRSPDWGGFVLHPWESGISFAIDVYKTMQNGNGGDVFAGRKLASWLRTAGFEGVKPLASYEIYDSAQLIAEYLALQLADAGHMEQAAQLQQWGKHPEAQFAQAWFEVVGQRT